MRYGNNWEKFRLIHQWLWRKKSLPIISTYLRIIRKRQKWHEAQQARLYIDMVVQETVIKVGQDMSTEQQQAPAVATETRSAETSKLSMLDREVANQTNTTTNADEGKDGAVMCEVTEEAVVTESVERVERLGFTLDIQDGKIDEYIEHHATSRPEVVGALRAVGIRNLR